MRKLLRFLTVFFYHRFIVIETTDKARERGLVHDVNVYGDPINHFSCRSFWKDKYGFYYRCKELNGYKQNNK